MLRERSLRISCCGQALELVTVPPKPLLIELVALNQETASWAPSWEDTILVILSRLQY